MTSSCSKDEMDNIINSEGGTVFRQQLVTITVENANLTALEYQGKLGTTTITVSKIDENTLGFVVPQDLVLGTIELSIVSLNAKIKYTIQQASLSQSADATLNPFMAQMDDFLTEVDTSEAGKTARNNIESFKTYFAQHASAEDKQEIALFYQINKNSIDKAIGTNSAGKFTEVERNLILKFKAAIAGMAIGTVIAIEAPHIGIKTLGIAIASLGVFKAIDYHEELQNHTINIIELKINAILGTSKSGILKLPDNQDKIFPISFTENAVNNNNSTSKDADMASFFSGRKQYNEFVAKVNQTIQWINSNVPFVHFEIVKEAVLAENPKQNEVAANFDYVKDLKFTIEGDNLSLVHIKLESDGNLNIRVKTNQTAATLPVSGQLEYVYDDGFSKLNGFIPIEIGATCTGNEARPIITSASNITEQTIPTGFRLGFTYTTEAGLPVYVNGSSFYLDHRIEILSPVSANWIEFIRNTNWENHPDGLCCTDNQHNGGVDMSYGYPGNPGDLGFMTAFYGGVGNPNPYATPQTTQLRISIQDACDQWSEYYYLPITVYIP